MAMIDRSISSNNHLPYRPYTITTSHTKSKFSSFTHDNRWQHDAATSEGIFSATNVLALVSFVACTSSNSPLFLPSAPNDPRRSSPSISSNATIWASTDSSTSAAVLHLLSPSKSLNFNTMAQIRSMCSLYSPFQLSSTWTALSVSSILCLRTIPLSIGTTRTRQPLQLRPPLRASTTAL